MTARRERPSIYVTAISKLLANDNLCEWAAWFQTHNVITKRPSDFDRDEFTAKHRALLWDELDDLESNEYAVSIENQNWFELHGKAVTLTGKPDIIAVRGDKALIIDGKTGAHPHAADAMQVKIYMWAVPRALPRYKHCKFTGYVIYKNHDTKKILPEKVNSEFVKNLGALMRRLAGNQPCRKVPSCYECKYCPVTDADCGGRQALAQLPKEPPSITDLF